MVQKFKRWLEGTHELTVLSSCGLWKHKTSNQVRKKEEEEETLSCLINGNSLQYWMQMVNMDKVLITDVSVCANNPYEPKFPYYGQTYSSGCEHSNPILCLWGAANQVCLKGEELKEQLSECIHGFCLTGLYYSCKLSGSTGSNTGLNILLHK